LSALHPIFKNLPLKGGVWWGLVLDNRKILTENEVQALVTVDFEKYVDNARIVKEKPFDVGYDAAKTRVCQYV